MSGKIGGSASLAYAQMLSSQQLNQLIGMLIKKEVHEILDSVLDGMDDSGLTFYFDWEFRPWQM